MREQLKKLYELNSYDIKVHHIEVELEHIPQKIADLDQEMAVAEEELNSSEESLAELEKCQREKQAELDDSQGAVKQHEAKLYQIKTNKEYQAAIREIAESKRQNREFEEEILRLMGEAEVIQKRIDEIKPDIEAKRQEVEQEKSDLNARHQELEGALGADKKAFQAKLAEIDPELMGEYEVARSRNPDAVAYVEHGTCQGCCISLRPQLAIEVQRLNDLHTCPNCQRLLFVKDAAETDKDL